MAPRIIVCTGCGATRHRSQAAEKCWRCHSYGCVMEYDEENCDQDAHLGDPDAAD